MTRPWHIRHYESGDERRILALRRAVFGDLDPVRLKESTWRWQFQNNPSGRMFCLLAESKGKIVGQYATIPTRFSIRGEEATLAFSCDTMIHPRYRRQGIFSALARELYDFLETRAGIHMVWGFPNEQSLPGFTGKLGWRALPVMPLMVLPINPLSMALRAIPPLKNIKNRSVFSKNRDGRFDFSTGFSGLSIRPIVRFDAAFDVLFKEHSSNAPVLQIRNRPYLQWRYLSVPRFGYRPFAVLCNEQLLGYLVLRMMSLKGQVFGVLVDLFPFPMGSESVAFEIFSFARNYVKAHGGDFLTCLLPPKHTGVLKRAGFKKIPEFVNPKTWRLGYRSAENIPLGNLNDWYITYGDTDVV